MYGGSILATGDSPLSQSSMCHQSFTGVDLSAMSTTQHFINNSIQIAFGHLLLRNCKLNTSWVLSSGTWAGGSAIELIGCDGTTSRTASIQDYEFESFAGTIDLETTILRTGGADDQSAGAFSYVILPRANSTREGTVARLETPWFSVWVAEGSATATIYVTNAVGDYNLDEMGAEFYAPDDADSSQFDITRDAPDTRLLDSSTAATDDTDSTWVTHNTFKQKFTATINPGYEGILLGRLWVAKRQASPDAVYVDPLIEIV